MEASAVASYELEAVDSVEAASVEAEAASVESEAASVESEAASVESEAAPVEAAEAVESIAEPVVPSEPPVEAEVVDGGGGGGGRSHLPVASLYRLNTSVPSVVGDKAPGQHPGYSRKPPP